MSTSGQLPLLAIVLMWILVSYLAAQTSGWAQLAKKYRCHDQFVDSWKGWQSARIGNVSYSRTLWVGMAAEGMYLKTGPFFLFRSFHPPLCIPWSQIESIEERKYWWWMRVLEIRIADPSVRILMAPKVLSDGQRFWIDKLKRNEGQSFDQKNL